MKTLIIAEAGINHNRDMTAAISLIDAAKDAGADVVKFQLEVGGDYCPSFDQMKRLYLYCLAQKMPFACTAFDVKSLEFLLEETDMPFIKIASKCVNQKLLRLAGKSGKKIILSTGNTGLADIQRTIEDIYLVGVPPSTLTLLHCVSAYPAPVEQTNLRAMKTIAERFGCAVGFSDHSLGIAVPLAAVALGAEVIEKHLTLDRHLPGPDHSCSAQPDEFRTMVNGIRDVEHALGSYTKRPQRCEL